MKKALLIGEYHDNSYNFSKIIKELNFKPQLLLVEGPFEKLNNKRKNIVQDFINKNPNFQKSFFINFDNKSRIQYKSQRNISNNIEIYGLEDLNLASFRSATALLCKNYYEIDNSDTKQIMGIENDLEEKLVKLFKEYRGKFLPLFNHLVKLSNEKTYTKNEKILIDWQMSTLQSIINQIDNGLNEKNNLYQITFMNQIRSSGIFDKALYSHSQSTRNKIFLESIQQTNNQYSDIAIIVGESHFNYLKNNLVRMNYEIIG